MATAGRRESPTSATRPTSRLDAKRSTLSFFYEIRRADNTVLKRGGGFATREAAATAGRDDVREMKTIPRPRRPDVGRLLVGQNMEKPTRC